MAILVEDKEIVSKANIIVPSLAHGKNLTNVSSY